MLYVNVVELIGPERNNREKPEQISIPSNFQALMSCPNCGEPLSDAIESRSAQGIQCPGCGAIYPIESGKPDLRLLRPKNATHTFHLGESLFPAGGFDFKPMEPCPSPQVDVRSVELNPLLKMGNRLTPELISYFPKAPARGGRMLDLGCGGKDFEQFARKLTGFDYLGCDYSGTKPDLLADGQALPFVADSFDLIISFAVLEHVQHPAVFMDEVFRVLKPGATFIGTVAFMEPFHMQSYYHMSQLGTYNILAGSGLDVCAIEPNAEWNAITALSRMSLYPRMPEWAYAWLFAPAWLLHRAWWKLGHMKLKQYTTSETHRRNSITGGFRFVAKKPS